MKARIAEIRKQIDNLYIELHELETAQAKLDIIAFKSGRHYSEHGQRIAFTWVDGGVIMADVDRHIYYFFQVPDCFPVSMITKDYIMSVYDAGRGEPTALEHQKLLEKVIAEALKL
jgi:hypothetical protein